MGHNGGNSDCWAIYSGNHDEGHYLDLVFIHKMKRRYTFSTDSFRIKIPKNALIFIANSIKEHNKRYKQQQFSRRFRSWSYPNLQHLAQKSKQFRSLRLVKKAKMRKQQQQKLSDEQKDS